MTEGINMSDCKTASVKRLHFRVLHLLGLLWFSSVLVSGEAAETRRAEHRCSWKREDCLFFLARPSLQRQ